MYNLNALRNAHSLIAITDEVINDKQHIQAQIDYIVECIDNAVCMGQYHAVVLIDLDREVVDILEAANYRVFREVYGTFPTRISTIRATYWVVAWKY